MQEQSDQKLKVLTWHIHGNYLYYLSQADVDFYLPVREGRTNGYGGRAGSFPWGENVHEVEADKVKELDLDIILFQSAQNYLEDQYEILSEEQRRLPKIYIEHDPPREHPTDTKHVVDDPDVLLVHVTHFNNLMWNSNSTPTQVINHGVIIPDGPSYTGEIDKGIVVVNNLKKRGRRLGLDVFEYVRKKVPLDLVGINAKEVGGLGEMPYQELHKLTSQYRFFFNPIRYTSLGLSVCEAMMVGLPIVGLATTEMAVTVKNHINGFAHTDVDFLVKKMKYLLDNPDDAETLGRNSADYAREHFSINRFSKEWKATFRNWSELMQNRKGRSAEIESKYHQEELYDEKSV
ncbi:MAG TPA: glycosyltransferase family 4 protein [Balneolaceae bacterium]|nr:glycosyltransferase family 4 protein [Balneolaceae bacterium]